jgi:CheY-like chemotaxis protein
MHRILLIEDDELLREGLKQVLEEDGCRVSAAADGAAGMELLRDGKLQPCLILLDLMMPGMNGWDFLQLHGRHPSLSKIPIAVASAYPFADKEVLPGIVLRKPFSPARLKQLISDHCLCSPGAARARTSAGLSSKP